jgi:hypothetical protein
MSAIIPIRDISNTANGCYELAVPGRQTRSAVFVHKEPGVHAFVSGKDVDSRDNPAITRQGQK